MGEGVGREGTAAASRRSSLFVSRRFDWVTTTRPDLSVGSSGVKIRSDGLVSGSGALRSSSCRGRQCSQSPLGG